MQVWQRRREGSVEACCQFIQKWEHLVSALFPTHYQTSVKRGHLATSLLRGFVGSALQIELRLLEAGSAYGALFSVLSSAIRLNVVGSIQAQQIMTNLSSVLAEKLSTETPKVATNNTLLMDIAASRQNLHDMSLFSN